MRARLREAWFRAKLARRALGSIVRWVFAGHGDVWFMVQLGEMSGQAHGANNAGWFGQRPVQYWTITHDRSLGNIRDWDEHDARQRMKECKTPTSNATSPEPSSESCDERSEQSADSSTESSNG